MSETKATYTTGQPPGNELATRLADIERKAKAKALALASLKGKYAASEVAFARDVLWLLDRLAALETLAERVGEWARVPYIGPRSEDGDESYDLRNAVAQDAVREAYEAVGSKER